MSAGWNGLSQGIALLLLAALPAFPQVQTPADTGADTLATGSLTVWISCHQKKDAEAMALKLELGLSEDYPKLTARFKGFSSYDFLNALSAAGKTGGEPPDIVYTDDAWQVKLLDKGATSMAGLPRFAAPGTWLIPANSSKPKIARGFILWLEEPVKLSKLETQLLTTEDQTDIRKAALTAVESFESNGKAPGAGVLDPALADFAWSWLPAAEGLRYSANVFTLGGNQRLAFAGVSALIDSSTSYGLRHATVILRRRESAWQVIGLLPGESFPESMKYLTTLDDLKLQNDQQSGITLLTLLAPLDQAQLPRGANAQFEMEQEGELGSLLAVEYQSFDNLRQLWSPTALTVAGGGPKSGNIVHSTMALTGRQPRRCRAWSINQSGAVTLSGWHAFRLAY